MHFRPDGKTAMGKNQKGTNNRTDKALTVIARDAVVKGKIEEAGEIVVHGTFEGEITSSESLTVAPTGVVNATVTSDQIYINGRVRGTLHSETVHLDSQARFMGDVHTPSLEVTEGAIFQGSCFMPDRIVEPEGNAIPLTRSA